MCPTPWKYNFPVKLFFSIGLGGNWYTQTLPNDNTKLLGQEIPRANLSHTIFKAISTFFDQIFGLRPRPSQAGPAPAQAQPGPGRARICPAGIFLTSAFSRRSGIAQGGAAEVENLPQEVENPPFGEQVGQIQAGQGFSRPPLILRGRANPCPA